MDIPNEESWSFFESLLTEKPPTLVEVKAAVDVIDNYLQLSSTADIVHLKKLLDSKFEKYLDHDDESPGSSKQPGNKQASSTPLPDTVDREEITWCKTVGKFGRSQGNFNKPLGVAINENGDVFVADSANNRIQVFFRDGHFKFEFGSDCLRLPNGVAVFRSSGQIVVTEMNPLHRVTIFESYGVFLRRFGENVVRRPQSVITDRKNRIIVVDVDQIFHIFDEFGSVLSSFELPYYMKHVRNAAVNDRDELLVCDLQNHCVRVFNYDGVCVGRFGGVGMTNYPRGVAVHPCGDILVVDFNRNLNFTIFTAPDGSLRKAYSKEGIMKFYAFALDSDGSVIFATKDQCLCKVQFGQSV